MTTNQPQAAGLPSAIAAYQAAADRHDTATALAQFTRDAVVVDDGRSFAGIDEIESFLRTAASEYTFTRTLVAAEETAPDRWMVANHLDGDFPGGEVDLNYEFHLAGGLITRLTIAP